MASVSIFHSHVWYIAWNLFCNVFYCMQANSASQKQRSGSSVAAAPAESSQAPPHSPLPPNHCSTSTSPPPDLLQHDVIQSTQKCWNGSTLLERLFTYWSRLCVYMNTWLLRGGWSAGKWSLLSIKFIFRLVNFSAPRTSIYGGSCHAKVTEKEVEKSYALSISLIYLLINQNYFWVPVF